ncbi:MAG: lysoplasmalogenase [Deltaproteobacteria bacterium]
MVWAVVCVVFVAALLFAERTHNRTLKAVAKTAASIAFCIFGYVNDAFSTAHGTLVFAGLVLSLVGDAFLLSKAKHWFLCGLVAFLIAHVMYGVAFTTRGVNHRHVGLLVAALFGVASVVWRWLGPHVKSKMRVPVLAYIATISWMLAAAIATSYQTDTWPIFGGALLFYLSDLFVARERFVVSGFTNKVFGLPLYYAGQLVLAAWATT